MLGVLDALIQLGAQVPAGDAQRTTRSFPYSRSFSCRARRRQAPALLDIFKSEQRWPAAWLAAGDLLLGRRAEGFAAAVVEGMTVHAQVMVTERNAGGGAGGRDCAAAAGSGATQSRMAAAGSLRVRQVAATAIAAWSHGSGRNRSGLLSRQVNASYQVGRGFPGAASPDQTWCAALPHRAACPASAEKPPVRAHVSHTIVWRSPDATAANWRPSPVNSSACSRNWHGVWASGAC